MSAAYSDTIRRWAAEDRHAGRLADADGIGEVGLGAGETGRRLAVRFTVRLCDDRIATVRYQVFGCGFTVAACAAAAALAEGRTLTEAIAITADRVDAVLDGLPPERGYCAVLAVEALQAAVQSARCNHRPVVATLTADDGHSPRVTAAHPVYRLLIDSVAPGDVSAEDRHLLACLLAVAAGESTEIAGNLGLSADDLDGLLAGYFPAVPLFTLRAFAAPHAATAPPGNPDIQRLLLDYLPQDAAGWTPAPSVLLTRILTARAARPGHLWLAMGLFARPELTAAIRRHLPALAAANHKGMRWKRFLFKQLCDSQGGTLCKTPDCGLCSDYALCFAGGDAAID